MPGPPSQLGALRHRPAAGPFAPQSWLAQSLGAAHVAWALQRGVAGSDPPQSTSVSVPFFRPSAGDGAAHLPALQTLLMHPLASVQGEPSGAGAAGAPASLDGAGARGVADDVAEGAGPAAGAPDAPGAPASDDDPHATSRTSTPARAAIARRPSPSAFMGGDDATARGAVQGG